MEVALTRTAPANRPGSHIGAEPGRVKPDEQPGAAESKRLAVILLATRSTTN